MGFNDYAFYISWDAIMLVASLPTTWLALKTRWEYKGKKDRLRTGALLLSTVCFFLTFTFELAADAYVYAPPTDNYGAFEATYSALNILASAFSLTMLLATGFVFFRTAVALLYGMSKGRKLGLTRIVEIVSGVGFALLVILAVVVWGIYIWYNVLLKRWIDAPLYEGPEYYDLANAYLKQLKVAVAYEWIYFAYATIFLPIVFLQVLGRRTDRIAVLLYTFAILLVDALHVIEVVRNLVSIHKNDPLGEQGRLDTGLLITVLIANSGFELIAIYCLCFMGMRDPRLLTGDDEPHFTPVPQHQPNHESWTKDAKYDTQDTKYGPGAPAELPSGQNGYGDHERGGPQELPGGSGGVNVASELPGDDLAHSTKPQSRISRFLRRS